MSHNTLIEKIKQDAATTVAEITAASEAKVAEITRETDRVITDLQAAEAHRLQKAQEQETLVAVSRAKQAGKLALQHAKREAVDALFAEIIAEIISLPTASYVERVSSYAKKVLPAGGTFVTVEAPAARMADTESVLSALGVTAKKIVPIDAIAVGFIAHAADGVYDASLDRYITEHRAELEMEVAHAITN